MKTIKKKEKWYETNWILSTITGTAFVINTGQSTNTFYQPVGSIFFVNSYGFKFTSTVNGISTYVAVYTS